MSQATIQKIEQKYMKAKLPQFNVGDIIEVGTIIREGDRKRTQKFKGLVIAKKGAGTRQMVTLRKISYGIGVEKKLPLHSPNVSEVKVLRHGDVRRAKLYYMRDRVGKQAMKVKAGELVVVEGQAEEVLTPEDIALAVEETVETPAEVEEVVAEEVAAEAA